MADNTTLSAAVGTGDIIITEDTGTGKLPVTGIVTGAHGVNGGRVTVTNPLFVELTDATAAIGVAARPIRTDPTGATTQPISVASYPASTYYSAQAAVSGAAKASAGNLKSFKAINRNGLIRYLQLFNSATAPAGGATALDEFIVPGGPWMIVIGTDFFTDAGVAFSTGIAWGFSSTSGTYTAATAADHDFSAVVV